MEPPVLEAVLTPTSALAALLSILVAARAVRPWTAVPPAAPVEATRKPDAWLVGPVSPPVKRQVVGATEIGAWPRA